MITIVDYGMCNLGSIRNMLKRIQVDATVTTSPDDIARAKKIILPGIGSFDRAMEKLESLGIIPALTTRVMSEHAPLLGICLGMQILTKNSREGKLAGLGWVDAETKLFSFPAGSAYKVPHMGWNTVHVAKQSPLTANLPIDARFYFVHSYYVQCNNPEDILLTTDYGMSFTSALQHDNILGVQFHPEKSHRFGMNILANFNAL